MAYGSTPGGVPNASIASATSPTLGYSRQTTSQSAEGQDETEDDLGDNESLKVLTLTYYIR